MNQIQTIYKNYPQKPNYFQIIEISLLKQNDLIEMFNFEKIDWLILFVKNNISSILVNAPDKLGRLLRKNKDYEFFTITNKEFKGILTTCVNTGYKIDNIDFLKYPFYEDEDEIEKVENLFFSGKLDEIIKFIDIEKIEINKVAFNKNSLQITFYRTGLIWFTGEIIELNNLLQSALRD